MFNENLSFWHSNHPQKGYFSTNACFSAAGFCKQLLSYLPDPAVPILFLCIGSDRLTGDSLGPLIGHRLSLCTLPDCAVVGTLAKPVHAENLKSTLSHIKQVYPSHLVIAIDAALDKESTVGQIFLHNYPIFPGAGVQKNLPCAGEISITGVVAPLSSGAVNHLSEIHLSLVVQMADCIVEGLLFFLLMRTMREYLTCF